MHFKLILLLKVFVTATKELRAMSSESGSFSDSFNITEPQTRLINMETGLIVNIDIEASLSSSLETGRNMLEISSQKD